jgi:archaemetzincin
MSSIIYVAPINNPVAGAIDYVVNRLPDTFRTSVKTVVPSFDLTVALNESRHQYNSTTLLAELLKDLPSQDAKVVGVTDVDLFIPILTFVFGEAQLNGNVAIASSYRLRNSFYGLPPDRELLIQRLEKEIVHELGHTYNLKHCDNYTCVMHASTFVEDIDLKKPTFCNHCQNDRNEG